MDFFGKLIGMACRHKIAVPLSLPLLYWKSICCAELDHTDLLEIDEHTMNSMKLMKTMASTTENKPIVTELLNQQLEILGFGSENKEFSVDDQSMTYDLSSYKDIVDSACCMIQQLRLHSHQNGLQDLSKGISGVVPFELFSIFEAAELGDLICGKPEVDVSALKRTTIYESISSTDK